MAYGPTYSTYGITATGTTGYSLTKQWSDTAVTVTLTGTFTNIAFTFEATCDGTNWFQVACNDSKTNLPIAGGVTISPSNSTDYAWTIPNALNWIAVRTNVSSWSTGTGTISGFSSTGLLTPVVIVSATTGAYTNITASGTLAVTGATTLTGDLSEIGNATVGGTLGVTGATTLAAVSATSVTATGTVALTDNMTITDAKNIILNATTGTKIGTATSQKLGFFNAAPVVQQTGTTETILCLTNLGLLATGAHPLTLNGLLTLTDVNMALGTSTGTIIGTATTQKLGFYGTTAVVQPSGNGTQATTAAGLTTTCFLNTTLTGGSGSTAYTVGDIVLVLKKLGLIAA